MTVDITERQARKDFVTSNNSLILKGDVIYTRYILLSQQMDCWDEKRNYIGKLSNDTIIKSENFM